MPATGQGDGLGRWSGVEGRGQRTSSPVDEGGEAWEGSLLAALVTRMSSGRPRQPESRSVLAAWRTHRRTMHSTGGEGGLWLARSFAAATAARHCDVVGGEVRFSGAEADDRAAGGLEETWP